MKKRISRPRLERSAPVRTWSTLFGSGTNGQKAPGKPGEGPSGAMDAVQRGVEFAYRVSDEYLRQGQDFARALSQPLSGGGAGGRSGGPADLTQLTQQMFRYTSELSTMWMEGLRMMSGGMVPGASPGATPTPPWPAPAPVSVSPAAAPVNGTGARKRVSLEIDSKLRVRASIDADATAGQTLAVRELRLQGGAARIKGVRVEEGEDGLTTVAIRIPPRQAPGTYQGQVADAATGAPVGTVTVRVSR